MSKLSEDLLGRPIRPAALALADGTVYRGRAFGAETIQSGEVVFNTSMMGVTRRSRRIPPMPGKSLP